MRSDYLIQQGKSFWSPLAERFSPEEAAMYIPSIDYRLPNTVSFVCNTQLLLVGIDHIIPKHESAYWTIFGLYTMSIALGITFHMIFASIFTRKRYKRN